MLCLVAVVPVGLVMARDVPGRTCKIVYTGPGPDGHYWVSLYKDGVWVKDEECATKADAEHIGREWVEDEL